MRSQRSSGEGSRPPEDDRFGGALLRLGAWRYFSDQELLGYVLPCIKKLADLKFSPARADELARELHRLAVAKVLAGGEPRGSDFDLCLLELSDDPRLTKLVARFGESEVKLFMTIWLAAGYPMTAGRRDAVWRAYARATRQAIAAPGSVVAHTEDIAYRERQAAARRGKAGRPITVRAAVTAASAYIRFDLEAAGTREERLTRVLAQLRERGDAIAREIGAQEIVVTDTAVRVLKEHGKDISAKHDMIARYLPEIIRSLAKRNPPS